MLSFESINAFLREHQCAPNNGLDGGRTQYLRELLRRLTLAHETGRIIGVFPLQLEHVEHGVLRRVRSSAHEVFGILADEGAWTSNPADAETGPDE